MLDAVIKVCLYCRHVSRLLLHQYPWNLRAQTWLTFNLSNLYYRSRHGSSVLQGPTHEGAHRKSQEKVRVSGSPSFLSVLLRLSQLRPSLSVPQSWDNVNSICLPLIHQRQLGVSCSGADAAISRPALPREQTARSRSSLWIMFTALHLSQQQQCVFISVRLLLEQTLTQKAETLVSPVTSR